MNLKVFIKKNKKYLFYFFSLVFIVLTISIIVWLIQRDYDNGQKNKANKNRQESYYNLSITNTKKGYIVCNIMNEKRFNKSNNRIMSEIIKETQKNTNNQLLNQPETEDIQNIIYDYNDQGYLISRKMSFKTNSETRIKNDEFVNYLYNVHNLLKKEERFFKGENTPYESVEYEYDSNNKLIKKTAKIFNTTFEYKFIYDTNGKTIIKIDNYNNKNLSPNNNSILLKTYQRNEYHEPNLLTQETIYNNVNQQIIETRMYTYDTNHNIIKKEILQPNNVDPVKIEEINNYEDNKLKKKIKKYYKKVSGQYELKDFNDETNYEYNKSISTI
ncbi:putative membrane protein [Candidatus Phytoplasma solani]|uniref:hypothetical protein n=1 Tax=Candidatus Phytoplasma solani TaxID=69896 RepID=UPI0032DAD98E